MSELKTLRTNLIVLSSVQNPEEIVAYKGKLYAKKSLSGRVIFWLCRFFLQKGNVDNVIKISKAQFAAMMERLDRLQKDLLHNEALRIKGQPFKAAKIARAEKEILYACLLFRSLFKDYAKNHVSYLSNLLADPKKEWRGLCDILRFVDRKRMYEKLTKEPVPYDLFLKMACEQPLKVSEEKRARRWIKLLKKQKGGLLKGFCGPYLHGLVASNKLHRFMWDSYTYLLKNVDDPDPKRRAWLDNLVGKIASLGLDTLYEADEKHQEWVQSLAKGQLVSGYESDFRLGDEVTTPYDREQEQRVFTINQCFEAVFYKNEGGHFLQIHETQMHHFGIPFAGSIGVLNSRGAAFRERVIDPLDQIVWTSNDSLSQEDYLKAKPLAILLELFNNLPYTPVPLDEKAFAFKLNGEMCVTRPMEQGGYFFEALEGFAFRIAQGNRWVFRHLMVESDMVNGIISKEYKEFVNHCLNCIVKNGNPQYPRKSEAVLERYENLFNQLKGCYEREVNKPGNRLSGKKIADKIFHEYLDGGFVSYFPANFALKN